MEWEYELVNGIDLNRVYKNTYEDLVYKDLVKVKMMSGFDRG